MDPAPLSRRTLIKRASAAAAVSMLAPAFATSPAGAHGRGRHGRPYPSDSGRFLDGLASGEPAPTGAVLWTRLAGLERRAAVELEVALEPGFRRVVARESIVTGPETNGAVKACVSRLAPHQQYYYRFGTRTQSTPVGRFRTAAPPGSSIPVRFAFFSCQDYTHGWFNALQHMAGQDLDFVVNLGDYIYAEAAHTIAGGTGVRDDPTGRELPGVGFPVAVTLDEYRAKYSLYRQDPALRALHASVPMISTWDDHEVQNDYNGNLRDGGLSPLLQYSRARRAAAYRAWFENMPMYPVGRGGSQIYRRRRFGDVVDLLVLDERQYRDAPPRSDGSDLDQPRAFLGRQQLRWLKDSLSGSRAAWKVIGNELMAMPFVGPDGSLQGTHLWHGYVGEREELLHHIDCRRINDVIFVTGDIHTFVAGDVRRNNGAGTTVALEFVGGSVTSTGLGELGINAGGVTVPGNDQNPRMPQQVLDLILKLEPWMVAVETDHHGYGLVEASRDTFDCRFVRMETVKRLTTATLPDDRFRWRVARGQTSLHPV